MNNDNGVAIVGGKTEFPVVVTVGKPINGKPGNIAAVVSRFSLSTSLFEGNEHIRGRDIYRLQKKFLKNFPNIWRNELSYFKIFLEFKL